MESLEFYLPRRRPPELARFEEPVRQLDVGNPGKLGGLRLSFRVDDQGRTALGEVWRKVPLQVLRPFYYDEARPGMAFVYVMNPTGGVVQGDRLRLDVRLEEKAEVHLTTQAATKIYRMNRNYATQTVNLELGKDAYLEYMPDQTIPYRDSRFYQEVHVKLHPKATLLYWEILAPGRSAEERFRYDLYYSALEVRGLDGTPVLTDMLVLQPKLHRLDAPGLMRDADVLGAFYALSPQVDLGLAEEVHGALERREGEVSGGVSLLALTRGLLVRVLGPTARQVREALEEAWRRVRLRALGCPPPPIRK